MASKASNVFASPKLIAVDNIAMTADTIQKLLSTSNIISYNLCFAKPRNKLPKFGFSIVPLRTLISFSNPIEVEKLSVVKEHLWSESDYKTWNERTCDNNCAVHITFVQNEDKPSIIKVIFSHENINSSVYSYNMNVSESDVYFMIFASKEDIDSKRISLLSNFDYLCLMTNGIMSKRLAKKFVPNECISCCSNIAEMVFLPCGHSSFCEKCANVYRNSNCPICKQEISAKVLRTIAANFCLMCPPRFNCTEVNAMLMPCNCVVGCIDTTIAAVRSGEECPNCERIVSGVQQIYF